MQYTGKENIMIITDRDITKKELEEIYNDFKMIEQVRYQFVAEENDIIIGLASGLTNH